MPSPRLQALLLDVLSTHRPVDVALVAGLPASEWNALLDMAHQHRLGPLLYWRLTRERRELPVPIPVRDLLATSFVQSTARALLVQRELLLVHRILDRAGVSYVALKGAYLAFHAYPHPALRPLRDLDILVPKEAALSAYEALLAGGLSRAPKHRGNLKAALASFKHLPPLRSPSGRIVVEVHSRLFDRISTEGQPGLIDDPSLWQRTIRQSKAGESLSFPSPTDLLLHVIVHAVHEHRFDNGPLVLSDSASLLERHTIDWPLFWRMAQASGQTRACLLLLKMVERYFGEQPVSWCQAPPRAAASLDSLVQTAALLTLRDVTVRADAHLRTDLLGSQSVGDKLGVFLARVFPSRRRIAARYPVSEDSPWLYFWYLAMWWHHVTTRLPSYFASRKDRQALTESRHVSRLEQWLRD